MFYILFSTYNWLNPHTAGLQQTSSVQYLFFFYKFKSSLASLLQHSFMWFLLLFKCGLFSVYTRNIFTNIGLIIMMWINDYRKEQQRSFEHIKERHVCCHHLTTVLRSRRHSFIVSCGIYVPDSEMVRDRQRTGENKIKKRSHRVLLSWVSPQVCDQHISIWLCRLCAGLSVISTAKSGKKT